uniref:Uncharacterized protein n=1 Tax=Anguilla anguilla TaxID=7936 RepID=A0A0E9RDF4_ANGAN
MIYTCLSWAGSWGLLEPIPACIGQEAGIYRGQVANLSQGAHTIHSFQLAYLHFFELWEETGVPGGNPCGHGECIFADRLLERYQYR